MKIYSRWNPRSLKYDYFQAMGDLRAGVFADTPRLPAGHKFGLTPEEATRVIPPGARPIGTGDFPRGMIAGRNSSLGSFGDAGTLVRMAMYGGIGWLAWKFVMSPGQKRATKKAIGV